MKAAPAPPRTHGAVVREARAALRRFREDQARRVEGGPWRLLLDVPLPVAAGISASGLPLEQAPFSVNDEGDWPGGAAQRFRALRQVVEPLLDGYGASFLGMLESPSDGLGVWRAPGLVVAGVVTNATFPAFARLADGDYGDAPGRPDEALLVAAEWTRARDIGQPWDWALRERSRELLDGGGWRPLYTARMVRTGRGRAYGCLTAAWGEPWRLYGSAGDESSGLEDRPLLESAAEPPRDEVAAALNAAAERRGGGDEGRFWGLW